MDKLEQIVQLRKLVTQYEQGLVTATEVAERIVLDVLPDAMLNEAAMVMPEVITFDEAQAQLGVKPRNWH